MGEMPEEIAMGLSWLVLKPYPGQVRMDTRSFMVIETSERASRRVHALVHVIPASAESASTFGRDEKASTTCEFSRRLPSMDGGILKE